MTCVFVVERMWKPGVDSNASSSQDGVCRLSPVWCTLYGVHAEDINHPLYCSAYVHDCA